MYCVRSCSTSMADSDLQEFSIYYSQKQIFIFHANCTNIQALLFSKTDITIS